MNSGCLDDARVKAFVSMSLPMDARREVEDHVDDCEDCRQLLVALVRTTVPMPARWQAGDRVGRYVVGASVGRGAMGEVFRAEDVELARPVALKRLHAGTDADARGRLVREARAAAQLQHPNVVAVYEIVDDGDRAVLATEWIDGVTLREWLASGERPWREIVQVVAAAGRGLAAAHTAGIIHRDFKPENVLVDREGRARVADFGLASHAATVEAVKLGDATQILATATGTIAGTPAYMAPELIDGARPDPRSDQFAFAVTLFEAVHGRYPFAGTTAEAIWGAMAAGAIAKGEGNVPAWLDRAMRRALSADPGQRFPDLSTFLNLLERKTRPRRGVPIVVAGALGGIAVAATLMMLRTADEKVPCGDDLVDGVWTPAIRADYAKQFAAVAPNRSAGSVAFIDQAMEQWAGAWRLSRRAACAAEPAQRRARTTCLDRELGAARAQIAVWMRADVGVVDRAAQAAAALPSPDDCTTAVASTPELVAQTLEVDALRRAGKIGEAKTKIGALADAAMKATDPSSKARALIAVGAIEWEMRDHVPARAHLATASQAARQAGDDVLLANALELDASVRIVANKPAEALGLLDAVGSLEPKGDAAAKLESVRGEALFALGRGEEAVAAYARSIAILEKEAARDPSKRLPLAAVIGAHGSAMRLTGQHAEGVVEMKRALAIEEPLLGPNHPEVARTLHDMAALQREIGEIDEATRNYQRVRKIFADAYGDVLEVAGTDAALADIAIAAGDYENGKQLALRALEGYRKNSASPALLSSIETALGNIEQNQDRCAAAIPHYEAALAAAKAAAQTGADLAISYANLAACLGDVGGRDAEARNVLEASLAAWKDAGDDSPLRSQSLAIYADLEAQGHRFPHAIELCEQSLAAIKGLDGEPWAALRDHCEGQIKIWRRRK